MNSFTHRCVDLTGRCAQTVWVEVAGNDWRALDEPGGEELLLHECWHEQIQSIIDDAQNKRSCNG